LVRSRRLFRIGGIVSGVVLVAFGIVVMVLAVNGHSTVTDELKAQQITGSPDMTPAAIKAEAAAAGLKDVDLPTCDIAGEPIDDGNSARCFAEYMNVHALEATGGFTYSQMGIYTAKPDAPKSELAPGGGTSNVQYAATDPETGRPVQNASRQVWVTETALATALNVSYMATQLSLFSLVVGIALLLTGVGFLVLAIGGALSRDGATTAQPAGQTAG
jgi:hypothetical protein